MTDQMFNYLGKLMPMGRTRRIFNSVDVSRGEDRALALDAQANGWLHIEPNNTYVTQEGRAAWLSEKNLRQQKAEDRAAEARKKPFVILAKAAQFIAGAVVTALIAQLIASLFQ